MARSSEALQRRAVKRNRSLQEQQLADAAKPRPPSEKQQEVEKALTEPGSWKCPSCANVNFASRYVCNSKTCQEPKPESAIQATADARNNNKRETSYIKIPADNAATKNGPFKKRKNDKHAPNNPTVKKKRHDPETSKTIEWEKPQATPIQIQTNQQLRKRFADNDPTLTEQEIERAKVLVARQERKKLKKAKLPAKEKKETVVIERPPMEKQEVAVKTKSSPEQRKANLKVVQKYKETNGDGMTEDEVERAKILIARKERKEQQQQEMAMKAAKMEEKAAKKEKKKAKKEQKKAKKEKKKAKEEVEQQKKQDAQ